MAHSGLQRNTGERMVPKAEEGYEVTLYYSFSDNKNKYTMFMAMSSFTAVPPAAWDSSLHALTHSLRRLKSFYWPQLLNNSSPVITHATVTYEGEALIQFVFKGIRSPEDMHVARNELLDHTWEKFLKDPEGTEKLGITIAVYAGWRVSLVAMDTRYRVIAASQQGRAFAVDSPRAHVEFRRVPVAANSAIGFDPAQIDFRFEDRAARLSCRASTIMAPPELLIIQNAAPSLAKTAREQGARVISPDVVLQVPQLLTVYDGWINTDDAQNRTITSGNINTSAVPGGNSFEDQAGTHVVVDAPPMRQATQQVDIRTGILSPPVRFELNNQTGQLDVFDRRSGEQIDSHIYQMVLANEQQAGTGQNRPLQGT